ncbi:CusA/CzcA family heavy metal efflux RND transporter [uncultured Helicobacter sp.]|uniref:efflux RND transporter permease subunit n=1 Tax=uncultured Helicobacter sp. TaxID=175537 RepID=UPI00263180D7|nr:CusA/CzcA family heavy metal efflux RND transporter [uncultured Helicobacter sp.]
MINHIIVWSVRNKLIVLLAVFLLTLLSLYFLQKLRLDALPDLTPPQVIVQVDFPNQSAKIIEEQVTYPLTSSLMAIANVESVRGISGYENALIYVIFKDKTDLYWARSRVLEQLAQVSNLPPNAKIALGSDSTSVGWAYQYALISKTKDLAELRSLQDFYYKYALLGIDGVSEVATIGGFRQNYEITLDNAKLVRYDVDLAEVTAAVARANNESGGGVIFEAGFEKIIRANGYIKGIEDLENIVIRVIDSTPLRVSDVASVRLVPSPRRGSADLNGQGEVVGGIVMVKYGGNTYDTLQRIKEKIAHLNQSHNEVQIQSVYDRSELIQKAIFHLLGTLLEESVIVLLVSAVFLLHFRSALIVIVTLPLCVLYSFLLMAIFGIESSIMSLGGIAIAIGAMVDAAIVMIENAHKNLAYKPVYTEYERRETILKSAQQVGAPVFFALIIIVVSFLPIFALSGQEERLFTPLAFTKTFAMLIGALLSITIVPILMLICIKGKIIPEDKNVINTFFIRIYEKALTFALKIKWIFLALCLLFLSLLYVIYKHLNWEFMPQINEGVVMYMPVSNVSMNIQTGLAYLKKVDSILYSFDEVELVFGKVGRANTSTDPAPLSMLEVYVHLKPQSQWQEKISYAQLRDKFEDALQIAGLTNSWTYPIRGRTDMLLTGIRTPLGIKLYGNDRKILQDVSLQIESRLKTLEQTLSVFAERANSGYYVDLNINDEKLARYGLSKEKIFNVLNSALGGIEITRQINGVENYPISVRLQDVQRNDIESIKEIFVKTNFGFRPLGSLVDVEYVNAPMELKSEKGLGVNFIYITPKYNVSAKIYKELATQALSDIELPNGYYYEFSGESEYLQKALDTLSYIVPLSIFAIFILIFLALRHWGYTLLCFLTLPFAILGGFVMMEILGYNLSIAGIVGLLALLGIAAETSIVMLLYLQQSYKDTQSIAQYITIESLKSCVMRGAAQRVRPKLMTAISIIASLMPIMYAQGVGSEIMKAIAAPMLGGMITSALLTLFIIPICFYLMILKKEGFSLS